MLHQLLEAVAEAAAEVVVRDDGVLDRLQDGALGVAGDDDAPGERAALGAGLGAAHHARPLGRGGYQLGHRVAERDERAVRDARRTPAREPRADLLVDRRRGAAGGGEGEGGEPSHDRLSATVLRWASTRAGTPRSPRTTSSRCSA